MTSTKFVDVILPLAVPNLYTYRVPRELNEDVEMGKRVIVQFGRKRYYTALIRHVHHAAPLKYEAKYLEYIIDNKPIVHEVQLKFWEWIADYYMCTIGDVLNAALPSCYRLASETKVVLNEARPADDSSLTDNERLVVDALEVQGMLSIADVSKITDLKNVQSLVQKLVEKEFVLLEEEIKQKYKPKLEAFVSFNKSYQNENNLKELFDTLGRAEKQLKAVMRMVELSKVLTDKPIPVNKKQLEKEAEVSGAVITQLVKKGIFDLQQIKVDRLALTGSEAEVNVSYSDQQLTAIEEIKSHLSTENVCLLHGVTGSGKTEVYIQLIADAIAQNKQVLYLLPEIALTGQMINRLKAHFGDTIGVYHSKFNQNERVELWQNILEGKKLQIVLGARSALFLPFSNLGLIVVDEEHENTFKQMDPAPRYNARDAALILANMHGAKVLLGSATPSVESYWNARRGKYGLVTMAKRYSGVQMPEIWCADLEKETKRKTMQGHFSSMLIDEMKTTLEVGEQIILFQNRRGYAPVTSCMACGWTPQCKNCDISLTFHKYHNYLNCHYCGHHEPLVQKCPACGHVGVKQTGFGTEKIEEQLQELFPDLRIARMDFDTTRQKHGHSRIITKFEQREIDVLVGTQMVTKGLDFDHVGLVGVLNADQMLNFPDFRSFERAYQLITQVSGRAGRQKKRGKVIIQTFQPNHWVLQQVMQGNYDALYKQEILERKNVHYPPFVRMIKLVCKHKDRSKVIQASDALAMELKKRFGSRVLGPEFPSVERIRNYFNRQLYIKLPRNASLPQSKQYLSDVIDDLKVQKGFAMTRWVVDVDPV